MQDNPARKPGYAGRVYRQRACMDCQVVYAPRSSGQKRCTACQAKYDRLRDLESRARQRKAEYVPRYCLDCKAEIPRPAGRSRPRIRCEGCGKAYRLVYYRERNAARAASGERRAYVARYRAANPEKILADCRKYRAGHPETDAASNARRRHRIQVNMTAADMELSRLYRIAIRNNPCFYCGDPDAREVDHFFPLAKGGTDHWWNLLRSCRACNRGPCGKANRCGTAFMLSGRVPWTTYRPSLPNSLRAA